MGIRARVESVVAAWAGISDVGDSMNKICDLWAQGDGHESVPCDKAVEDLIQRLIDEFKDLKIRLLASDFKKNLVTVNDLVGHIASVPAIEAFSALLTSAAASDPNTVGTSRNQLDMAMAKHISRTVRKRAARRKKS